MRKLNKTIAAISFKKLDKYQIFVIVLLVVNVADYNENSTFN